MKKRLLWGAALLLAVAANAFVAHHAWVMTHFDETAEAPVPPEKQILAQRARNVLFGVRLPRSRNARAPSDLGLRFETHALPGKDGRDLEAWYIPAARSRGVVAVFPGFGRAKASHLSTAKILNELGYDALLVDFYGTGGSKGSYTTIGWLEAHDVGTAARHARLLAGAKPVVLLGTSMGAAAVMRAVALGEARPDAVVLESPYLRFLSSVKRRFELMRFPVTTPFAEWMVVWGSLLHGFNAFSMNPVEYAREVKVPALALFGEEDLTIKPDEARELYDAIAGPKTLKIFPGIGHNMLSEWRPDEWRETIAPFLKGVTRAP